MLERSIIMSMVRCSSSVDQSCQTNLFPLKLQSQWKKDGARLVYLQVAHGVGYEQAYNLGMWLSSKKLNLKHGNKLHWDDTQTAICFSCSTTGFLDKNNDLLNRNLIEVSFSQPMGAFC